MIIRRYGLYFAWLFATLGMLISIYFSDVKNMEPCHLCWYQRIALFPLFFILGIATYRGYTKICPFVLPQVGVGLLFSLYQIAIQQIPDWNIIDMCGGGPSCSEKILIGLGPITIPMLAAFGFFVIGCILIAVWYTDRKHKSSIVEIESRNSI